MTTRPATHARLERIVRRWRAAQALETHGDHETPMGKAYRECANDLELALRDDKLEQPRR